MKKSFCFILPTLFIGMLCLPMLATATDLTTLGDDDVGSVIDGRIARYTTLIGDKYADTTWQDTYQGLYDYISYPRSSKPTWVMNNGVTSGETAANTFNAHDVGETSPYETAFGSEDGFPYDFFGYKFKQASTVTSLVYTQEVYNDGGTFASTPTVEVLTGGTWTPVAVSWDTPYDSAFGARFETYTITLANAATNVMGVRLIGDATDEDGGASAPDTSGFVSVTELQVNGVANFETTLDMTVNLALGQDTIWTHGTTQKGRPEVLTDGNCQYGDGTTYDSTFDNTQTAAKDFVGVMFDEPQTGVGAVGAVMVMFRDGGEFKASTLDVEYLPAGSSMWVSVTGLDLGSYDDNYTDLQAYATINQSATQDRFVHSDLFTFDPINQAIDGIRLIGSADTVRGTGDGDGFVGMMEMEVFAATVPEPSTIVLLLSAGVACLLGWMRRR